MSAATVQTASGSQRAVVVAAVMAIYLQAVCVSIPNAALLYIQGTLSMSDDEVGWIFTAYLTASVVSMTMTRWLAGRYGRKIIYQASIAVFALGLVLATQAQTTMQFIAARIIQGAAGGALAPLSTAMLLDIVPPSRHGRMNSVIAVTLVVGLLSGPPVGGWLSEYYGWTSLFYVGVPFAGFIFLVVALSPPQERTGDPPAFDFFGLATFSLGTVGLQMMLDRGERMEWFHSTEIWAEATASGLGFYLYIVHVLTAKTHFLSKSLFRDRNFVLSTVMYFAFGFVLLPTIALTSPMLDEILNYPADTTGYLSIPRSIALVMALLLTGRVAARFDARVLIAAGMALVVYANWQMLGYSLEMDWWPVVAAGMVQGLGLGILLPSLTRAAFSTLAPEFRAEGTALFNLSRSYGSTIGIAVVLTFFYDNTQAMHVALAKDLVPYRAAAHVTNSMAVSGLAMLNDMITGQAALIGVIDQFEVMMIAMLIVSPLVLFLRKPRPVSRSGA